MSFDTGALGEEARLLESPCDQSFAVVAKRLARLPSVHSRFVHFVLPREMVVANKYRSPWFTGKRIDDDVIERRATTKQLISDDLWELHWDIY